MTCPVCNGRPRWGTGMGTLPPKPRLRSAWITAYEGCRHHDTTASVGHCKYRACLMDKRKVLDAALDDREAE